MFLGVTPRNLKGTIESAPARDPGVCGGRATFKYTRIEISGTLDRLNAGESIDDIVEGYEGSIPYEAVLEAIRIGADDNLSSVAC